VASEPGRICDGVYTTLGAAVIVHLVISKSRANIVSIGCDVPCRVLAVVIFELMSAFRYRLVKRRCDTVLQFTTLGYADRPGEATAAVINKQQVMYI